MQVSLVADYLNSTPEDSRVRRKVAKAIKRFRHLTSEDLAHARRDLQHAKEDLASVAEAFEHLLADFEHAIGDFTESGRDPGHAREDHTHAEAGYDAAEEKLHHAGKDFAHALKDFGHAIKDLEQIEDIAEFVAEAATESGQAGFTAELVRIYIREEALKDPQPKEAAESVPAAESSEEVQA
jgi:Sec-independent protein translocase protein TatA